LVETGKAITWTPASLKDDKPAAVDEFLGSSANEKTQKPMSLDDVDFESRGYCIVFVPGGHGAMIDLPDDNREHGLSDLTVAPDGTVYATDSRAPIIWKLAPGAEAPEPVVEFPGFSSLQGILLHSHHLNDSSPHRSCLGSTLSEMTQALAAQRS
jgi:hypothetical protein